MPDVTSVYDQMFQSRATLNFSAKVLAMATVMSLEEGALETMGCQVCNPHFNPHFAESTLDEALRIMIVLAHPAKSLSPNRATSMQMLPSSLPSHPSGGSAVGRHLLHLLESHHETIMNRIQGYQAASNAWIIKMGSSVFPHVMIWHQGEQFQCQVRAGAS